MASAPPVATTAAPIRQPRGPPADHTPSSQTTAFSPPEADLDSLRRSNTFSTPRHHPSASISSSPAGSSAFHGRQAQVQSGNGNGRFKVVSRFRSGSLSSGDGSGAVGLARRGSGREAVRTEEVVVEDQALEEGEGMENRDSFAKGLSRQSSLPSRRFVNPVTSMAGQQDSPHTIGSMGPPPRPPRRLGDAIAEPVSPPPPSSAHTVSHSLSSLQMFSPPAAQRIALEEQAISIGGGAGVSRTQSLRAQAKHTEGSGLGRSSSMRTAGEQTHRGIHEPSPVGSAFTPPTPPPVSSTAALPPFQLGHGGGDIKRHQSLNQGYGRLQRERLERTNALLSLDQREEARRRAGSRGENHEPPPTSPIGPSMWSAQAGTGENGWSTNLNGLSEVFDALQLNRREAMAGAYQGTGRRMGENDLLPPMPATAGPMGEPSWVANLVGHEVAPRSAHTPNWADRDALLRQHQQGILPPHQQQRWDQGHIPLAYLQQQQQQQQLQGTYGLKGQYPGSGPGAGFTPPNPGYMGGAAPMYPSPPVSAHMLGPQDQAVIELARAKGLNPASYNCRPPVARFFVIKSYTEEDVQKSLKHEIWSSTVLGNKRLDTAFRESSDKMPIYLFFSVNGSRHFCGVAEMLTPVDETQSSTVWAQDKWKGIFRVKWIFVRDVPTSALRHIRLLNTPEQKPITNSRDTQELHYEAGCEVLQIFLEHQTKSKTSLLQDFAYYEQLSAQRGQSPAPPPMPHQVPTPPPMPQQYAMPMPPNMNMPPNPNMNMPMNMPMGGGGVPPVPPIPARFR